MIRNGFDPNLDLAAGTASAGARRAVDLTSGLSKQMNGIESMFSGATKRLQGNIDEQIKWMKKLEDAGQKGSNAYKALGDELENLDKKMSRLKGIEGITKKAANAFDSLGKKLLSLNVSIMSIGFKFLVDSIKRVYELQERWTKAIGGFNMRMGGMTAGLKGATKAAGQWSGAIRGLTDGSIEEGIQMFADFTDGIGHVVEAGNGFSKFGLQLARGFNLGGEAAGKLTRTFENLNMTAGESAVLMTGDLTDAANMVGVPVNMLAKDIADANDYLARFGKEGAKNFVTAAGYARKFGMSMKELQKVTERFDMLDDAVTAAAKFNTMFGTAVNGVDLMLEDDPAKRMEMFRQQMLRQGKTYDTMTPKMRRLASEMFNVNETQLSAILGSQNAGEAYEKMQREQAKKEKSELQAKKDMNYVLRKTAQTMYSFGAAFDRITTAIGKAIEPLLEVFGLGGKGGFGGKMGKITDTIESFFLQLAKNEKWMGFMRMLGQDLKDLAKAAGEWIMSGDAAKFVGDIASAMKGLYEWTKQAAKWLYELAVKIDLKGKLMWVLDHSKEILGIWLAFKAANVLGGFVSNLKSIGGAMGGLGSIGGKLGGAAKGLGGNVIGGLGGSSVGGLAGGVMAGQMLGSDTGSALGGAGGTIGGFLGPVGAALGAGIGAIVGKMIDMFDELNPTDEMKYKERIAFLDKKRAGLEEETQSNIKKKNAYENYYETMRAARDSQVRRAQEETLSHMQKGSKEYKKVSDAQEEYWKVVNEQRDMITKQIENDKTKLAAEGLYATKAAALDLQISKQKDIAEQSVKDLPGLQKQLKEASGELLDPANAARYQFDSKYKTQKDKEITELGKRVKTAQDANEKLKQMEADRAQLEKNKTRLELAYTIKRNILLDKAAEYAVFQSQTPGISDAAREKAFFEMMKRQGVAGAGEVSEFLSSNVAMAAGGIVNRPTRALIGEAGPEAVIPLRAMARGKGMQPNRLGGAAAKNMVNYAAGAASAGQQAPVYVAGDVYLDGAKVGRTMVRTALGRKQY